MYNILLASSMESFVQLISVLLIFIVVLVITYFATRWMAGVQRGKAINKNLRVVETINVGSNKLVSLVEAGNVYLVIAIGKEEVNLLAQLDKDQLKDLSFMNESTTTKSGESFKNILDKFKDTLPKKQD